MVQKYEAWHIPTPDKKLYPDAKLTTYLMESIMELFTTIKSKDKIKIIADLTSQLNVANKTTF